MRLQDILTGRAAETPNGMAVVSGSSRLTYGTLAATSDCLAGALAEHGVRSGDRVAVFSDNWAESVVATIAVLKAGATACPVHPLSTGDRLAELLRGLRARAMITEARLAGAAAIAIREAESVRLVVLAGTLRQQAAAGCIRFEDAIARRPAQMPLGGKPDDVALLIADPCRQATPAATLIRHRELVAPLDVEGRCGRDEAAIITSQRLLTRDAFAQLFAAIRDGKTLIHSTSGAGDVRPLAPAPGIARPLRSAR